ncbi:MAG TPA: M50 family metallopeptidase, partial [Alphaproteobacteria bacterium]|nr:M50 family metallopeptidase [Alphaproteobacteria bacterium]
MIESSGFGYSLLMFLIVLTVLVFVHEMGHYWVARRTGVRVDVFSIGFGPEIFGWTDSVGTRWKISWIPLGGYVKFFGDMDVASRPDPSMTPEVQNALRASGDESETDPGDPSMHIMTEAEKAVAFPYKKLWQRSAIVAAGPLANFVFAIVVFAGLFMTVGQPYTPAKVGTVEPGSAAAVAGIEPGDKIVQVGSTDIDRFEDLIQVISMSPGETLKIKVIRDGKPVVLTATPKLVTDKDAFGEEHKIGRLGVGRVGVDYVKRGPIEAVWYSVAETGNTVKLILKSVGQLIVGERSTDELRGPLTIA